MSFFPSEGLSLIIFVTGLNEAETPKVTPGPGAALPPGRERCQHAAPVALGSLMLVGPALPLPNLPGPWGDRPSASGPHFGVHSRGRLGERSPLGWVGPPPALAPPSARPPGVKQGFPGASEMGGCRLPHRHCSPSEKLPPPLPSRSRERTRGPSLAVFMSWRLHFHGGSIQAHTSVARSPGAQPPVLRNRSPSPEVVGQPASRPVLQPPPPDSTPSPALRATWTGPFGTLTKVADDVERAAFLSLPPLFQL